MQTEITSTTPEINKGFLTEKIIQKVTLGFLKTYYKYRPRMLKEPTVTSLNMRTSDGIIADGFYSFKKPNGQNFLATFEATCFNTQKEVTYKKQKQILFWDGLAVGSILTACAFTYGYAYDLLTVNEIGPWPSGGCILLSLLFFMMLYRLIGSTFSRYRYIYAVEQFKNYHADEQWIAIGHDVFSNPMDKHLKELKNQCVYNGFGLLAVDKNFEPKVLITPAREEVFKGKRKKRKFKEQSKAVSRFPTKSLPSVFGKMSDKLATLRKEEEESLSRFSRSFTHQMLIVGVAMLFVGVIFVKELADADLIVMDKEEHFENIENLSKEGDKAEEMGILVDTAYANRKPTEPYKADWWLIENEKLFRQQAADAGLEYASSTMATPIRNDRIDVLLTLPTGEYVAYDCERFMNFTGTKYVVEEGVYADFASASARMQFLASKSLTSNVLNLNCFEEKQSTFIVFFSELYHTKKDATFELEQINFEAEEVNIDLEKLEVRALGMN